MKAAPSQKHTKSELKVWRRFSLEVNIRKKFMFREQHMEWPLLNCKFNNYCIWIRSQFPVKWQLWFFFKPKFSNKYFFCNYWLQMHDILTHYFFRHPIRWDLFLFQSDVNFLLNHNFTYFWLKFSNKISQQLLFACAWNLKILFVLWWCMPFGGIYFFSKFEINILFNIKFLSH